MGFHCDNGSEFLNHKVVQLLNKLLVEEFTKSRACRTTDNALVEGKNGAVVRKQIGYGAIGAEHAEAFQKFHTAYFNPYLIPVSGSSRIGIKTRFQAHFWIGKCCLTRTSEW